MPSDVSLMAKKFYFFDCLLDGVRFNFQSSAFIFFFHFISLQIVNLYLIRFNTISMLYLNQLFHLGFS